MEQQPLYNALNFNVSSGFGWGATDLQNTTVLATQISSLLCPSENANQPTMGPGTRKSYMANVGGPANFMMWSGIFVALKDDQYGYAGLGNFHNGNCGKTVSLASVTDGTSNTALISESLIGSGPAANQVTINNTKRRSTYLFPTGLANPVDQSGAGGAAATAFVAACKALPGSTAAFGTLAPPNGNIWLAGNPSCCLLWDSYNHFMPPNSAGCVSTTDPNSGGYGTLPDAMPPSSNHPGGVNVVFADGSVRFIKDSVNIQAWWALGTRNGGEVIGSDQY
jgi:prepilin-type processing-associated H-X9-DG protein